MADLPVSMSLQLLNPNGSLHPPQSENRAVSIIGATGEWNFPLPMQETKHSRLTRVQVLETPDTTAVDNQGISQPVFEIEGTFGTRCKSINGVIFQGKQITTDLTDFITYYATRRNEATRNDNIPLIEMAYHDFNEDIHWIVSPRHAPQVTNRAQEPLRNRFSITFQGIRKFDEIKPELVDLFPATFQPDQITDLAAQLT